MSLKDWITDPGAACTPPPSIPDKPDKPRVIVLERPRLNDDEIAKALQGNHGALWFQAIVSKIEQLREDNLLEASRAASAGNQLAMAGGLNTYEAFSGLLHELDAMVQKSEDS